MEGQINALPIQIFPSTTPLSFPPLRRKESDLLKGLGLKGMTKLVCLRGRSCSTRGERETDSWS